MSSIFRCIIHGSFSKHFDEIQRVHKLFSAANIEVLAPKSGDLLDQKDGFALFADEIDQDPRQIELAYLHQLKRLGKNGFSYFVNPEGYVGRSASYELGIAQAINTRCFFSHPLRDHPAYVHGRSVWTPERLIRYIQRSGELPLPRIHRHEKKMHELWQRLVVPESIVATGAIIEHGSEVLLVKTHKWGHRYSIIGGKVKRGERLHDALLREVKEETMLRGEVGRHLCTFDQIRGSGYYEPAVSHIFVDYVVRARHKRVILNDEAQEYVWVEPRKALQELDIEPNARLTLGYHINQLAE